MNRHLNSELLFFFFLNLRTEGRTRSHNASFCHYLPNHYGRTSKKKKAEVEKVTVTSDRETNSRIHNQLQEFYQFQQASNLSFIWHGSLNTKLLLKACTTSFQLQINCNLSQTHLRIQQLQ